MTKSSASWIPSNGRMPPLVPVPSMPSPPPEVESAYRASADIMLYVFPAGAYTVTEVLSSTTLTLDPPGAK